LWPDCADTKFFTIPNNVLLTSGMLLDVADIRAADTEVTTLLLIAIG
jgi:hypothetical protein